MVAVGNSRRRAEQRKKPRRQFNYNAKILADKKGPSCACSISDVSETGARIVLERDIELPSYFILLLTPRGDARRRCRVVWRTELTVGVEFTQRRA